MTASEQEQVARAALAEISAEGTVGDLLDRATEEDGVSTLNFEARLSGYPGWHWTVSVAELPDEAPTVLEAELIPGDGALLAPDWVPWAERLEEYRAAQAAAAETGDPDDESEDEPEDEDDFEDVDDDAEDDLAVSLGGDDEQDESEDESADDGPEQPAES